MRLLAFAALLVSLGASLPMDGQSLAEHAATVSGASIGTAAGRPIGTSLGKMGNVDEKASQTGAKTSKPVAAKPVRATPTEAGSRDTAVVPSASLAFPDAAPRAGGGSTHRPARAERNPRPVAGSTEGPVFAAPYVKEPSVRDVASIKVGASASDLRAALGTPESRVSIPDDGHLIEICQYWANGEQVGTIRLDNGHVVSVQTSR